MFAKLLYRPRIQEMEDEIIQMIKDGDLDRARREILDVEDSIRVEISAYNRRALLNRVKMLKEVYSECSTVGISKISLKKPIQFEERSNSVNSTKDKTYVRNVSCGRVRLKNCTEAVVENCSDAIFEYFECRRSVFFMNVKNCQISCSGQQIRISNCSNIELTVYTSTGVFLQNSTGIVIKKYGDDEGNRFENVCDFSNSFSDNNFKIL